MNMRWNLVRGLGLSISVFLAGLSLASFASAQTVTTTPLPATGTVKHTALQSLRQAHKLLVNADHDYDGHRARAAEEVHKAIRELEGTHRAKTVQSGVAPVVTTKPAKVKQPAIHEPQAVSDGQLAQALTILQGVQTELTSHHPKALANVKAAIGQINTALKLK
jgi:hypothetical protein